MAKKPNKGEALPQEQLEPIVPEQSSGESVAPQQGEQVPVKDPIVQEQSSEVVPTEAPVVIEREAAPGDVMAPRQEEIPTQDEAPLSEESFAGIADALNQKVEEMVPGGFSIGQKIDTKDGKGIIVDYNKFVKYAFGLTILHNPGLAVAFVGQAGKSKLMGVLNITDRAEQEATWAEFKELYHKR